MEDSLVEHGESVLLVGDSRPTAIWRQFAAPWIEDDIHDNLKSMSQAAMNALFASIPPGVFPRFNGSPYFPMKVPDLIGIKNRKYIDHTGTHRLRGPADVMRYAALVSCCDSADFGTHRILTGAQRKISYRMPDDSGRHQSVREPGWRHCSLLARWRRFTAGSGPVSIEVALDTDTPPSTFTVLVGRTRYVLQGGVLMTG